MSESILPSSYVLTKRHSDFIPDPLKYADRPARKQVAKPTVKTIDETSGTYNIWYGKWTGDTRKGGQRLEKALSRCVIDRDAGYTKSDSKGANFCSHFARGACMKGHECFYQHRIAGDNDRVEATRDIFGRDKHRDEREDMGGVGTFDKINRTLYIGHATGSKDMELVVRKHFSEWGEIDYVRCLDMKGVAFVRYKNVANAEFAKEAMFGQSLDCNEVLNVRWATEDPNPKAQEDKKRKMEELFVEKVHSALPVVGEGGSVLDYQGYYADPNSVNYNGYENYSTANYGGYYYSDETSAAPANAGGAVDYSAYQQHNYDPAQHNYDPATAQNMDPATAEAYAKYCADYYAYYNQLNTQPEKKKKKKKVVTQAENVVVLINEGEPGDEDEDFDYNKFVPAQEEQGDTLPTESLPTQENPKSNPATIAGVGIIPSQTLEYLQKMKKYTEEVKKIEIPKETQGLVSAYESDDE